MHFFDNFAAYFTLFCFLKCTAHCFLGGGGKEKFFWTGPAPLMMSTVFYNGVTVAVTSFSGAQYLPEGEPVIYLPAGHLV